MLPGSSTLLNISSHYQSLTKTEQKIADAVLSDPEAVVYSTLTDLAERAGVGETSVLRLCRKLKFRGYHEFKLAIAQDLVTPIQSEHGDIEDTDEVATIARKITSVNSAALENTLALLDMREVEKAIEAIVKARKVYFFGIGSSAYTALDAKYRYMRLGFDVEAVTDSHLMAMAAALMTDADVVFGISTSGSTRDIVDAIQAAKRKGVYVICLTNHARSPLTQHADAVLLTKSREAPFQSGAFNAKIAQIHVLDILSTATALRCKERSIEAIRNTANAVLDKLY
ncbi:MurR/RpiR family transcriptional regulator [Paenibacillus sp. MBLB4367]|uniref:MurR/RpiR family transcriptional regulator n=1 Tax=Paenibacillus sp. MBLB4367 TaxID=3384767 RepID=UPI00390811CF